MRGPQEIGDLFSDKPNILRLKFFDDRLDVILESEPDDLELPPDTEREVYYVLREGLTNVTRHSHASRVEIHLSRQNGRFAGSITDNGVGFGRNDRNHAGFGLTGMERRIKELGGELVIKSSPGHGTDLRFTISLTE